MQGLKTDRAVVLFSGGQDSTTCLFWAKHHFERVEAVIFDYGQRHRIEIEQAECIAKLAHVEATVLDLTGLGALGGSALTDTELAIPTEIGSEKEVPNTFVPGRNLIFLSYAAAYAYPRGIKNLVLGVGQVDYSGYPDCRVSFVRSAEMTLTLALDMPLKIHAPLLFRSKADIWALAAELGCLNFVIRDSHSCYAGDRTHYHPWGYGCGTCAACRLRAQGFYQAFPELAAAPAPPPHTTPA